MWGGKRKQQPQEEREGGGLHKNGHNRYTISHFPPSFFIFPYKKGGKKRRKKGGKKREKKGGRGEK